MQRERRKAPAQRVTRKPQRAKLPRREAQLDDDELRDEATACGGDDKSENG
jgi:hypothetical protein